MPGELARMASKWRIHGVFSTCALKKRGQESDFWLISILWFSYVVLYVIEWVTGILTTLGRVLTASITEQNNKWSLFVLYNENSK